MKLSFIISRISLVLLVLSYSISIQGQHLTISNSGQTGTSGTNWSMSSGVLEVTGPAIVHPNVITSAFSTGNVYVQVTPSAGGGTARDIAISSNIVYTGSQVRSLTFKSTNSITVSSGVSITSSNGPLNVVLHAGSGTNPDNGRIVLDGVTINTNGGHFRASGGASASWNGLTVGAESARTWGDDESGISFVGSTLTTSGGSVYMDGMSYNTSDGDGSNNFGINMNKCTITSGAGQIDILGSVLGRYTNGLGTHINGLTDNVTISSTSGTINITGTGSDQSTNNNGWRSGVSINASNFPVSITSVSGAINITGTASFANSTVNDTEGIYMSSTMANGLKIVSQTGNISLAGSNTRENTGQLCNSLRFAPSNITDAIRIGYDGVNPYSGNIILQGNSIYQLNTHPGSGSISIQSTGSLIIQPKDNEFTFLRAGVSSSLTFDDDWNFGTTLGSFTFGKSTNTLDLSYASPLIVAGPITFHTGNFTINRDMEASTASNITINARQNFNTSGTVRRTISSAGGNITINADADANGSGQLDLDYLTLNPGVGNTIIRGETFLFTTATNTDKPYINGIGSFTLESSDASFGQLVQTHWFLFDQDANGIGGLTLGKATNTSNVLVDAAHSIAGPIQIYGGDITIGQNLNTSTGGANGDVLLKSSANILLDSRSITTNGGDVIFWANSDGQTADGGVFFKTGSAVSTSGGHIWIGGGSGNNTWNGLTVGNGWAVSGRNPSDLAYIGGLSDWYAGIAFIQTTLSSGGGNIYIAGQRNSNSPVNVGAGVINNSGTGTLIDAGAGTVTIKGDNTASGNGAFGIMTGLHPNGYTGRFTVKSSNSTATSAITVDGTSSAGTGDGILIENHARFLSTATTNGGGISISGTGFSGRNALSVGIGANAGTLDVLSASGAININVGIYPLLVASQGNMKLGSIVNDADVGSSTANVVITSNNVSWTGSVPIRTFGTLIVTPTTGSSFAATLNSSALNYSGISGLVLGNATNTAGITIGTSTSIAGPITCYGGDININENINTTAGAASGDILLKASGNIFTAANKSITTNNGDVILWADSDNTGNGSISLGNNTTINTANELTTSGLSGGGKVVLAGGNDDGSNGGAASDGIPDGFAASSTGNGISLGTSTANTTLMYSGGGDIIIRGKSTYASGTTFTDRIGMFQYGKWTANAGKGSIIITGTATGFYGVNFTYPASNLTSTDKHLVLISDKATGDAIKITGTSNNDYGVVFNYLNPKEILATGGGNISITGTAGGNYGVFLQNQDILATGGTITLDGGSRGILSTQYGARFGARSGTTITTSSANVVLAGDVLAFDNLASGFTNTVTTAGTLAVQPSTISFASALAWPIPRFTVGSGITGMTLGKSTNVSNVTISSSQSIAGPITIYGGTITLNQNISSSTGGLISLLGNTVALGFPITLVNGDILLGSSTVVNGTPTNYFKTTGTGTVKRSVANGSSFTYPVGNSSYNPVTIANNTNESDDFSVRVADQVLANGTTGTAITDKVVNRTWHIGKTNANASPGINFTFQWNANEELGTLSDYKLSHFGNSAWALAAGTSGPVSGTTTKTMAHTGYTGTFSPFAIGSTSSVLPVSWLNFTGKKVTQGVELNWSTSSEQNTKDFQVQHSINAQQWTSVGNLPAAGNSNTVRNYRFVHEGPFKNSIQHYYRILQRDLDGKFSYSKVIRIEYLDGATDVVLYPNPASDVLHINITERQELRLVNIQGVVVWKGVLPAGRHEIPVSNFATGNYILQAGKGIYRVVIQ